MSIQLRRVADVNPPVPELRLLGGEDVTFLPLEAVWPDGRRRYEFTKPADAPGYTGLCRGDVVMPKITPTFEAGRVFVADDLPSLAGLATTEVHILRAHRVDPRYLAYFLRSLPVLREGATVLQGVGNLRRVSAEWVSSLSIPVNRRGEQRRIADYLDRETATIDTLIAKQYTLIQGLRERRQVVIEKMVSGQGSQLPLRRVVHFETGRTPATGPGEVRNEGLPWFTPEDLSDNVEPRLRIREVQAGEVPIIPAFSSLVCCIGATLGKVGYVQMKASSNQQITACIPVRGAMDPRFLYWSLVGHGEQVRNNAVGNTMPIINQARLSGVKIVVPPPDGQREIAEYLDRETAKIDALIAKAERFIELAQERRAALITAAVTGQIEIPTED